jgi:hypothetical protein
MLRWRLSIMASPSVRLDMVRHLLRPMRAPLAALAALVLTLALGRSGAPLPLFRGAPLELSGLVAVTGFGLLAWHLARLTALPLAEPVMAALAAALIPALMLPGLGANALLGPVAAGFWLFFRHPDQRVVALMVQCGALAAAASPPDGDFAGGFIYATTLGIALILLGRGLPGAANDNPSMERVKHKAGDSKLMGSACYANAESIPGKWGVS